MRLVVAITLACATAHATPADDPVARWAPTWERDAPDAVISIHGKLAFEVRNPGPATIRLVDLETGARGRLVPLTGTAPSVFAMNATHLVVFQYPNLIAYERLTLADKVAKELWRVPDVKGQVRMLQIENDAVYAITSDNHDERIESFELATGKQRWKRMLGKRISVEAFRVDGGRITVAARGLRGDDEHTVALGFDTSGQPVWRYRGDPGSGFEIDFRRVLIVEGDKLAIIDRNSGAVREVGLPDAVNAMIAIDGELAYLAGTLADSDAHGGSLIEVSLQTGRARRVFTGDVSADRPAVIGPVVVISNDRDELLAIDRTSGNVRWRWGTRPVFELSVVDGALIVLDRQRGLTRFAPAKVAPPIERARIRGRLEVCGLANDQDVMVGDQLAKTDEKGRYSAIVEGRGWVTVRFSFVSALVHLTGKRSYTAGRLFAYCDSD